MQKENFVDNSYAVWTWADNYDCSFKTCETLGCSQTMSLYGYRSQMCPIGLSNFQEVFLLTRAGKIMPSTNIWSHSFPFGK